MKFIKIDMKYRYVLKFIKKSLFTLIFNWVKNCYNIKKNFSHNGQGHLYIIFGLLKENLYQFTNYHLQGISIN